MLGFGLLISLFDAGPGRTLEQSKERTARIHQSLAPVFELITTPENRRKLDEQLDGLNLSEAPEPRPERFSAAEYELFVNTTGDFLEYFFDAIGYTAARASAEQASPVPPMILLSIPQNWADDKSVALKKSLFFRVVLPLVLLENRKVLEQRELVETYVQQQRNRTPVPAAAGEAIRELAIHYGLLDEDEIRPLGMAELESLLLRIDIVPPSLALAQAAYESGYGTSRFAHSGNALFGQWDWSRDALKPDSPRKELGTYGIKAFEQPLDSVKAYLRNLNTHWAYEDFRQQRALQRNGRSGRVALDSMTLAATLQAYSELGSEYTSALQEMIAFNKLTLTDDLRLDNSDPVYFD